MRIPVAMLVLCGLLGRAAAQDKAAAEAAFREARRLMAAGRYEAACPKLEASQRLDPATGTLLNLADCYAKLGRTASAWAAFVEVTQRDGKTARAREAARRAAALEPRLIRLRIEVADPPGDLEIARDGEPATALVGDPIPIDPGRHEIVAMAGGLRHATDVRAEHEGETVRIVIPPFWRAEKPPPPVAPPPPRAIAATTTPEIDVGKPRRLAAAVTAGAGVVAIAVGLGFGAMARSSWNDSRPGCDAENFCSDEAYAQVASAQRSATISTVLVVAGGAAVATGGVLWLTAPRGRHVAVVPAVAPGAVGLAVGGRF